MQCKPGAFPSYRSPYSDVHRFFGKSSGSHPPLLIRWPQWPLSGALRPGTNSWVVLMFVIVTLSLLHLFAALLCVCQLHGQDTNCQNLSLKVHQMGLPWWFNGKESACQCRRHRFDPWSGRIPQALGTAKSRHHNFWACTLEPRKRNYWSPRALEPALHNKRRHLNEKPVHRN